MAHRPDLDISLIESAIASIERFPGELNPALYSAADAMEAGELIRHMRQIADGGKRTEPLSFKELSERLGDIEGANEGTLRSMEAGHFPNGVLYITLKAIARACRVEFVPPVIKAIKCSGRKIKAAE